MNLPLIPSRGTFAPSNFFRAGIRFATRLLLPGLIFAGLCASSQAQVKWNPGHYARVTGDIPTIAAIENVGINHPSITGVVIRIPWKTLEPAKDTYDLSRIQYYIDYLAPMGKHLIIELRERNYAASATDNNDAIPAYLAGSVVQGSSQSIWLPNYGDPQVIDRYVALLSAISAAYDLNPNFEGFQSGEQAIYGAGGTSWFGSFVQLAQRGKAALPHTLFWAPLVSQMFQDPAYTGPVYAAGCGEYLIDSPVREVPDAPDGWNRFAMNHPNEFPLKANGETASWHDEDSDPANGGPAIYYNTAVNILHAHHVAWTTNLDANAAHPTARPNWWSDVVAYLDNGGNPRPTNSTVPANIAVTLIAPSNLTATPIWARQVNLTWKDNAPDETGFILERRTGSSGSYNQIATLSAVTGTGGTGNYSDTTVLGSTSYSYRIRAVGSAGSSSFSNDVSVTTQAADTVAPVFTSVTASPNSIWPPNHKMVNVTVTAALIDLVDPAPTARIVSVDCNESTSDSYFEITGNLTVKLLADRAGSGSGRIYTLHVEGRDFSDNVTVATVHVTVPHDKGRDRTAPSVAIMLPSAGGVTGSAVVVAAEASDDVAVAGVQFELDGVNLGAERTVSPYTVTWDTTTTNDGTHVLTAIARDTSGNTTTSSPVEIEVVNPPAPPTGLGATVVFPTRVDLAWTDNSDNESQFRIERKAGAGAYALLATAAAETVMFSDATATPGTSYTYRVRAENGVGSSAWSNEISATTPGPLTIEFETATIAANTDPIQFRTNPADIVFQASANGDAITFAIPGVQAGTYTITVRSQFGQNRAIYQLESSTALNGPYTTHGAPVDTYVAGFLIQTVTVGTGVNFDATSPRYFRFRITGKNATSNARFLSLDQMILTPASP